MKSRKLLIVLTILIALLVSEGSMAHGGGGGHGGDFGGHGWGGHGGGFRGGYVGGYRHYGYGVGVGIGFPYYWPYYAYPYYAYPPYYSSSAIVMPSAPPVYIEQRTVAKVQPLESNKWDYCANPEGYYPHVKECPAGWQRLEPQPIGQEPGYWYYCTNPAGYYPYVRACSANWLKVVP